MYVGGSEARRPRALCKNSNIKGASFFCASGAGWRCQLPPTRGGPVGLRCCLPTLQLPFEAAYWGPGMPTRTQHGGQYYMCRC